MEAPILDLLMQEEEVTNNPFLIWKLFVGLLPNMW